MSEPRPNRKWAYRNAKPIRSRVVKAAQPGAQQAAPRGVQRRQPPQPIVRVSHRQARMLLAAALVACVFAAAWWLYRSPYLTVSEIAVEGNAQISADAIAAASGLRGDSAFSIDVAEAERRVAALPKVRSARVEKHGWTGITITVEERVVWGSWQVNGTNIPIDIDGRVLDGVAPEGAPVIIEVEAKRVINAGDVLDSGAVQLAARLMEEADTAFGRDVKALVYKQESGLTAVLGGKDIDGKAVWVTFGDSRDYEFKVASLYALLEQAEERNLALNAVDLRFGDRLSFN